MLFNNYNHKFKDNTGRLIFVPTKASRVFGEQLRQNILSRWSPPLYYYHFRNGGHVAAAKVHKPHRLFVHLDIARFFDSITRSRVHRSLRLIGFKHHYAFDAACKSTVSKSYVEKSFTLPFGFVQSSVLASIALSTSALGRALNNLYNGGMTLSTYMDDVILSGDDESALIDARASLEAAASVSGFSFNPLKSSGPCAESKVFNLVLSHDCLVISEPRFLELIAAMKGADVAAAEGMLSYVALVNRDQRALLGGMNSPYK